MRNEGKPCVRMPQEARSPIRRRLHYPAKPGIITDTGTPTRKEKYATNRTRAKGMLQTQCWTEWEAGRCPAPRGGLRPLDPGQGLRPWTPGELKR